MTRSHIDARRLGQLSAMSVQVVEYGPGSLPALTTDVLFLIFDNLRGRWLMNCADPASLTQFCRLLHTRIGPFLSGREYRRSPALDRACRRVCLPVIRRAAEYGASDINCTSPNYCKPLLLAVRSGSLDTLRLVMELGGVLASGHDGSKPDMARYPDKDMENFLKIIATRTNSLPFLKLFFGSSLAFANEGRICGKLFALICLGRVFRGYKPFELESIRFLLSRERPTGRIDVKHLQLCLQDILGSSSSLGRIPRDALT
ncbi:hypothetical protein NLG97_g4577 [Lecanicillium saksenae]|uniref:Uncharacterized protein n=1 Tax=Lecanicillium saksenae TaxID=468837 RepID=A0ACC1QUW9_9HYPO|nr:hypothetical protein NLG97_g4577 [Lecanicillium saksenae]